MAARRISIRKILQTLVTMIAVAGCAVAMISADRRQSDRRIAAVEVRVESPAGVRFVTEEAVRERLFRSRHLQPGQLRSGSVDERKMESILDANPWVEEAEVYTDANRVLRINVMQRVPEVRVFEESGNSYYLDAALKSMPLSTQYSHYTPVVTGVRRLRDDSAGRVLKGTILSLVHRINRQPFWSSQISQIDMRADGGFEIVPIIGDQRIIIGDTDLLEDKLANLMAFYQQVQNRVGWDRYRTIDLRYKDQVVASPALSWKAPVDRAISTMNWLTAIMENTAATKEAAGGDAAAFGDSMDRAATPVPAPRPAVPAAPARPHESPAARTPAPATPKPGVATPARQAAAAREPAKPAPLKPAAAAPKGPKPPQKPAPKPAPKDAKKQPVKNTSRQPQNSPSHAATNR